MIYEDEKSEDAIFPVKEYEIFKVLFLNKKWDAKLKD